MRDAKFAAVFLCGLISLQIQGSLGNLFARRLYHDLLGNYNRLIRPVSNNSDTLTVKLGLKLSQLIDVDLKNQVMTTNVWVEQKWFDYKLTWNPEDYDGVEMLYVPSQHIWLPDIVLFNNADGKYEVTLMTKASLNYTGEVVWKPPAIYKSSCKINVEWFPFDEQSCDMKFGSWTYDGYQVDLKHIHQVKGSNIVDIGIDLKEFYLSVEWDILAVPATRNEEYFSDSDDYQSAADEASESDPNHGLNADDESQGKLLTDITFMMTLRRKTLFYTVNLIIPCVGISFLTVLVFYLPSDSGEKVTLCISILLSLTVFFLLLAEIIPPTSLAIPLLGKYLLFTMILVTLSICVTVGVLNIHFRSPATHRMSPWVRKIFIQVMPRLLLMSRPNYIPRYTSEPPELKAAAIENVNEAEAAVAAAAVSAAATATANATTTTETKSSSDAATSPNLSRASTKKLNGHAGSKRWKVNNEVGSSAVRAGSSLEDTTEESIEVDSKEKYLINDDVNEDEMDEDDKDLDNEAVEDEGDDVDDDDDDEENEDEDTEGGRGHCQRGFYSANNVSIRNALRGVEFIAQHIKNQDKDREVIEDWKFIAMVLDRLFLWMFTAACLLGTLGIIFRAPSLYDSRQPIDQKLSEIPKF